MHNKRAILIDDPAIDAVFGSHAVYWGDQSGPRAIDKLFEEMAELEKEILKDRWNQGGSIESIIDEAADVAIALEFLLRAIQGLNKPAFMHRVLAKVDKMKAGLSSK